MDIIRIANDINQLKIQVQKNTYEYMCDTGFASVVDEQLKGYIQAIIAYCSLNNLKAYAEILQQDMNFSGNAIKIFCLWDGIKTDVIEHSTRLSGSLRHNLVDSISYNLQQSMTKDQIDVYLGGFAIEISDKNYTVNSKRVYVQNTLKDADGITIMNIAKDLNIFSPDIIANSIEITSDSKEISRHIEKCRQKMNHGDFDGAITNARTLVEEVLLTIEENICGKRQEYDGDILALYKRVSKQINMYPDNKTENAFNQILRGFISIINGLSSLSNNLADRHATVKRPSKHHAKIIVNSALILSEFLLESFQYQLNKHTN